MADTIRELTVRGKAEGLDNLASALKAVDAAQKGIVQSGAALQSNQDGVVRKTTDASRAFDALNQKLDPGARAIASFTKDFGTLGKAFDQGAIGLPRLLSMLDQLKSRVEAVGASASRIDQSGINKLLGIGGSGNSAAASASAMQDAFREQERQASMFDAAMARRQQQMRQSAEDNANYQAKLNAARTSGSAVSSAAIDARMGIGGSSSSARSSASVFEEQARADQAEQDMLNKAMAARQAQQARSAADSQGYDDRIASARSAQNAGGVQSGINERLGIGASTASSARESAAAFEQAAQQVRELQAAINPLVHAQTLYDEELEKYNGLARAGVISSDDLAKAQSLAKQRLDAATANYGGKSGASQNLRPDQYTNLGYQVNDIVSGFAMGQSPTTILTQQGGQVYQALAGARGGLKGGVEAVGSSITGIISKIGPLGAAIGAVAAVATAAGAAFYEFSSRQMAVQQALAGIGKQSGATAGDINLAAKTYASAGNVSTATARQIASAAAATGKIGPEIFAGLITATHDYAKIAGEDIPAATTELTTAFANPSSGIDTLQGKLGYLSDAQVQLIKHLQDSGDRLGAQRALLDAIKPSLTDATGLTTNFGSAWERVKNAVSDAFDALGNGISSLTKVATLQERIVAEMKKAPASRSNSILNMFGMDEMGHTGGLSIRDDDEIAELQEQARRSGQLGMNQARNAGINERSQQVGNIVREQSPTAQQLRQIEERAQSIKSALELDRGIDPTGAARKTMDGLLAQAKQLREDLTSGGASFADSLRNSALALKTVNFSPTAQNAAQINNAAQQRSLDVTRAGGTDSADTFAKLQAIEMDRITQLQTLEQQSRISSNTQGGAFQRAPANVQGMILDAETRTGISRDIIAGLGEKENGFRLTGGTRVLNADGQPSTTAQGFGQITVGAERDIQGVLPGFNRFDPNQAVLGAATYLRQLQDRSGGDQTAALAKYYSGSVDPKGLTYAADVQRRAGTGGGASNEGLGQSLDANQRAISAANDNLKANTDYYGKNGLALAAATEANKQFQDMLAKGVSVTDALRASIMGFASEAATSAQRLKLVQYAGDAGFEREQIGRSSDDQAAYSKARSVTGDTDSAAAQFIIGNEQVTSSIKNAKDISQSAFTGFISDLRSGKSAAEALKGALDKIADKLLNMVSDQLFSKAFGGLIGGSKDGSGGGSGGFLGSLFGGSGSGGGGFSLGTDVGILPNAQGGMVGPGGRIPLRTYSAGGIATSPQLAMFGEGTRPEAYVPLSGGTIPVSLSVPKMPISSGGGGGGSTTIVTDNRQITMGSPANGVTQSDLALTLKKSNDDLQRNLASRTKESDARRSRGRL